MWKNTTWSKKTKWGVTAAIVVLLLLTTSGGSSTDSFQKGFEAGSEVGHKTEKTEEPFTEMDVDVKAKIDELVYMEKIIASSRNLSGSMQTFSKMSSEPLKVYTDDDYKMEVVVAMAVIQNEYRQTKEMVPPPRFASIHKNYLQALTHYNTAMDNLAYGIDNVDADSINKAVTEMEQGTVLLNQATMQINELED
jgi:hypothetical protein